MDDVRGARAVVTGGASGIGLGLATSLLERGAAAVALVDVEWGALDDAVAQLRSLDRGEVIGLHGDVTDPRSMDEVASSVLRDLGGVEVVCLNAGVFGGGAAWETTEADWDWVLGVNLRGVINGVRAFVPELIASVWVRSMDAARAAS